MRRREFITLLAVPQSFGRWPRERSNRQEV